MDFSRYERLSENAQQYLCFYVIYGGEKRLTDEWYLLSRYCFYQFNGSLAMKELREAGIMVSGGRDWWTNSVIYEIESTDVAPVILYAYMKRRDLVDTYKRTKLKPTAEFASLRKVLSGYVEKRFEDGSMASHIDYEVLPLLASLTTEPEMVNLLACLSSGDFFMLCNEAVQQWTENDELRSTAVLTEAIRKSKNITEVLRYRLLALCDLYNYMAYGETSREGVYQSVSEGQLQMAYMLAKAGKYEAALELFEKRLTAGESMSSMEDFLTDSSIFYFYYVLCLMHVGGSTCMEGLKKFISSTSRDEDTLPAIVLAEDYLGKNKATHDAALQKMPPYYAYLIAAYFGKSLMGMDEKACTPSLAILRHEMMPFLSLADDDKAELTRCFGDNMVLASIPHKAEWESMLERITQEVKGGTRAVSNNSDVRLMYLRQSRSSSIVTVREQKRLKSGAWGSGKNVSDLRYRTGNIDCMDDVDRRILNRHLASPRSYMGLALADCAEDLVGTDRLYYGSHAPYEQVKVDRDVPYLMVEKEGTRFVVKSNITLQSLETDPIVVENSTTHYTVMHLTTQEKSWYQQLLQVGSFPLEAEQTLRDFLPTIGGKIEVHSSLIEGGSTLPAVDGSPTIVFKLCPRNNGNYEVGVYVRPLQGGNRTNSVGKGDNVIIDENENGRCRVNRDLKAEKENLKKVKAVWKEAEQEYAESGEYPPEFVLDLIQFIQANPDLCYAEWPEGQTLRLRSVAKGTTNWSGVVKARGQWFEVEGDIQIDNDTVISISKLLELISQSHGKYIRMSDGEYLSLSEKLQQQLRSLEAVANRERGKLRISPFSAALMNEEMLNGEITFALDKKIRETRSKILASSDYKPPVPAELNATLRPYQVDGYQWIARLNSWGAGALLADDMGLGKTIQTIAFLLLKKEEGPSLVVAPASVAPNWKTEMEKFAPTLRCEILNFSSNRKKAIDCAGAGDVIITTYGILLSIQEFITAKQWNVVCLDEAHIIKNRGAKTSAAAMKIQAANRVMLTGTPVQNHLGELWSLFQFVNPGMLGGYENFSQKFIIPIEGYQDREKQEQLDRIVHPFMLRRTKQAVLKELPDKTEIYQPVELSKEELAIYEGIRQRAEAMLESNLATKAGGSQVDMHVLAEITRLRQAACSAKIIEPKWNGDSTKVTALTELLQGIVGGDNRVLVFSQFVSFLDIVRQQLEQNNIPYLYIDGSVSVKKRTELIDQFQSGQCSVFLISLKAGGLGLNLTNANYVIHLDPWWNPAIEQQATDRAYRIGQKQAVTVYHLISKNTIEEKIIRLHQTKRDLADNLLSGTDVSHKITGEELLEMIK